MKEKIIPSDPSVEFKSALSKRGLSKYYIFLGIGLIFLGFIVLAKGAVIGKGNSASNEYFRTEAVIKGDLTVTVTATGTLEPLDQVEVGVEVSGTISSVEVDYNDHVKAGQIIAQLDTSKLEAQVFQSQAKLDLAHAKLLEAKANIKLARSKLEQYTQARKLTGGKLPSQIEMDEVEAELAKAIAEEMSAKAEIANAQAELEYNKVNLSKAIIRAPLDGIVLSRNVEPGQTVAASFQTPTLFIIAHDLTEMELHVDVDEADIGKVRSGQKAIFTVDTYPNKVFEAVVKDIRLSPETNEGVVTYETVLSTHNPEGMLLPGMTATADITVSERKNVTLIPNAALRFRFPQSNSRQNEERSGGLLGMMLPRFPRQTSQESTGTGVSKGGMSHSPVWILKDGKPEQVIIVTGDTDGSMTEVVDGGLTLGDQVITGILPRKKS